MATDYNDNFIDQYKNFTFNGSIHQSQGYLEGFDVTIIFNCFTHLIECLKKCDTRKIQFTNDLWNNVTGGYDIVYNDFRVEKSTITGYELNLILKIKKG